MPPGEIAASRALAAMDADEASHPARWAMRCPDCGGHGVIVCRGATGQSWRDECDGCQGSGIIEAASLRLVVAR